MSDEAHSRENATEVVVGPVDPNFPEVSGTTLPLLSGILAGFAITGVIQLALSPNEGGGLATSSAVAIATMLVAVVCFLTAIAFSIKAQASNYLPFLDASGTAIERLNVDDAEQWLAQLGRRWMLFHMVAISTFYAGALLLMGALSLLVWVFVAAWVSVVFLLAVLVMVAGVVAIDVRVSGMRVWMSGS